MAIGTEANAVIYQDQFLAGYTEQIAQMVDVVNANSAGSIIMRTNAHRGHFLQRSFFKRVASTDTHRGNGAGVLTPLNLDMDEIVGAKINRKFGPFSMTDDFFLKQSLSPEEGSFYMGQQFAEDQMQAMLTIGLNGLLTVMGKTVANTQADRTAQSTTKLTSQDLLAGLRLMGDADGDIVAFAMHSESYYDLIENQLTDSNLNVFQVGDMSIMQGVPQAYGRTIIKTDHAGFRATDNRYVLALTRDAVMLDESEAPRAQEDIELLTENPQKIFRVDYAVTPVVKGWKFSTAQADRNPDPDTAGSDFQDAANWTRAVVSDKNGPGIRILYDVT